MTIATVPREQQLSPVHPGELPLDLIENLPSGDAADGLDVSDAEPLGPGFAEIQANLQAWLRHWAPRRIPAFTSVRDVAPAGSRGRSALQSAPTQPDGAVRITASVYDPPNRDGAPLSWSRNWASLAVLPPAPETGRLYYRFRVSSRLVLDGAAALSLVSTSLNFGIVADAATASPFSVPGFATPLVRPLVGVQCRPDTETDATQLIEGSIAVRKGETPAMAFVIGTDVLFSDGWIRVHEGSSTWIGPADPGASGIVEYRFAPASMLRLFDGVRS